MNIMNNVFEWILEAGLRASLLVPVVLGVQWLLRKQLPATWRYALWLPVLVALLVPALPILPSSLAQRLSLPDVPDAIAATTVEEAPAAQPSAGTFVSNEPVAPVVTQRPLSAEGPLPLDQAVPGFAASSSESTSKVDSPATIPTHPPAPIDWRAVALWGWLAGAVAVGLSILASFVVTMRRVKRTALPVHPDLLARVAHLAAAAGLRLSLIHISEPTRRATISRMPSSA